MENKHFLVTASLTILISTLSFVLVALDLFPYGVTLFCIMPVYIGYVQGARPVKRTTAIMSGFAGLMIFLGLLIITKLESFFCVLTLFPMMVALFLLGVLLGQWLWKMNEEQKKNRTLKVVVLPVVFVIAFAGVEKYFTDKYDLVTVTTSIKLPYSKEQVFDYIKSVDTLAGDPKPLLFYIGIQQPLKCVLQKDSIGAKRTCYFKQGTIDEIVTEIKRGEVLRMKITAYNMPGRKWLHFQDAIYLFKQTGDSTELTRITTYKTELKPRFYWHFFETAAVETEHEYVLNDLKKRMDESLK